LGLLNQQLTDITPNSISYNQIKFFFQQKTIELSGTAKTRNDLLSLKNSLEKAGWIKKINLPMDNLVDKENNQFQITIELNEPEI
jgi:Tfp pilus assembly protein PilN